MENTNFDKQFHQREVERMDFIRHEDIGNNGNYMDYFEEADKLREEAVTPKVNHIKDGS